MPKTALLQDLGSRHKITKRFLPYNAACDSTFAPDHEHAYGLSTSVTFTPKSFGQDSKATCTCRGCIQWIRKQNRNLLRREKIFFLNMLLIIPFHFKGNIDFTYFRVLADEISPNGTFIPTNLSNATMAPTMAPQKNIIGEEIPRVETAKTLIVLSFITINMFALRPFNVHSGFTALFYLFFQSAAGIYTFDATFATAASQTVWYVFSCMCMAIGLKKTTLVEKLCLFILKRGKTKWKLFLWATIVGALMAPLIPSAALRATMCGPITTNILAQLGNDEPIPNLESAALHLTLLLTTINTGYGFLTSTLPGLIIVNGIDQARGASQVQGSPFGNAVHVDYFGWMWRMALPQWFAQSFVCFAAAWLAWGRDPRIFRNYKKRRRAAIDRSRKRPKDSWRTTMVDLKIGTMVILAEVLLITDGLFIHLSPAYIGLGTILVLATPKLGAMTFDEIAKDFDYTKLMVVIAVLALGAAWSNDENIDYVMSNYFHYFVQFGEGNLILTYLLVTLITLPIFVLTTPEITAGICGTLWPKYACLYTRYNITPLSAGLCVALVMPLVFFPFQSAPILVQSASRFWTRGQFTKMASINAVLVLFVIIPVNILWWFPACTWLSALPMLVAHCNADTENFGGFNVSVFDRKNGVNKTFYYVPGQCNPMQNGMPWTGDV